MKKTIQEKSKFGKKALDLSEKIIEHYKKDKPEDHPYSFSANRYRISLIIGIILMVYGLLRTDNQKTKQQDCMVVDKISDTISNGKKSITTLYDIYKDGGLQVVSDLSKKENQKIHIDFSKTKQTDNKNILICNENITAKIGMINKQNNTLEHKIIDFSVGDIIYDNRVFSNSFLQLSENDNVTIAISDNLENKNIDMIFVSDIKKTEKHNLGFYDFNILDFGGDRELSCNNDVILFYDITDLSNENYKLQNNIGIKIGHDTPIILDRILVGKNYDGKFKVITKLNNICIFKDGIKYDLCDQFWKIKDSQKNYNDIVMLEILAK